MKLSILDQSPISTNQTANEALQESMKSRTHRGDIRIFTLLDC